MARNEASQTWASELLELGYLEEMPAPSPLAQALLCQIKDREFHEFLVRHEQAVQNDGESILANFDIAMWLEIFGNRNPMDKLMHFRSQLANIIRKDYEQIKECLGTINKFIVALLRANVEGIHNLTSAMPTMPVKSHPLLQGKELCEEATNMINDEPQAQPDEISPESFKAHMYPIIPVRVVEDLAAINGNKMWTMWSLQLVAPFSLDALITLIAINGGKSIDEFKAECYRDAINNMSSVQGEVILKDISMEVFDAGRCSKPVKLHCKGKIPPLIKRSKDYYKLVWNYNRPFIKCTCQQGDQCPKSNILWFDHALWFLANNMESCWITSDKLEVQFISFIQWLLLDSTKEAIRALVVFMYTRELMITAAEEYAEGKTRLLQSYGENEGPRYIEQLFLPQEFSASLARKRNAPTKRFNLNLNEAANEANSVMSSTVTSHYTTRGRGRNRGGRGRYFTPQHSRIRGYVPNPHLSFGNGSRGNSNQATPTTSVTSTSQALGMSAYITPKKLKYQ